MKRKLLYTLLFSSVIVLTACGGGGGGSSPYSPGNPYLRTEVPYATPTRVATVDPVVNVSGTGYKWAVTDTFTADLSGTGGQDVVVAGRLTQPTSVAEWGSNRISVLSWQGNTLVDKTSQWFSGTDNIILGTEPSVKFADFFKTGRQDMLVAPSTDMTHYSPGYVFTNNGASFTRQTIALNNIWSHDSVIADVNGDTYKDILFSDFGANTTLAINNRVNGFTTYTDFRGTSGDLRYGGAGITAGDFLQNGSSQIIVTDNTCGSVIAGCGSSSTKMYTWSIDGSNRLQYTFHSDLPTPRFDLPKWAGHGFAGSHNVRAYNFDFNDDNVPDALIFSMPKAAYTGQNTKYSEIQFLRNNGTGTFTDVTDATLVGYNTNTYTTYNPKFIDLNGDGKTDILVSGSDFTGTNNSTQFLLKSNDGKYVAAYQNILTDFATQANSIQGTDNTGNTVNILRAPNGKLYLITAVSFMNNTDRQLAVYMSELGSQSTTTAQSAINLILQKWPYMTVPQANEALARTSATYFGGRVLDLDSLMNPIGSLSIPNVRGMAPINGFIAGVNLDSGQAVVMDELKRSFSMNLQPMNVMRLNAFQMNMEHNDQHNLTSHAEYLVNGPVNTFNNIRVGGQSRNAYTLGGAGEGPMMVNQTLNNYTVGVPNVYSKGNWSFGTQYTALNQNPWVSMGGAWGTVTNSNILDNVVTYRKNGFSTQASFMHVTTNITPGLVTNVSNMTGGWAESGYRYTDWKGIGDIGFYAGVKPVVFSGNVTARIPTSVDNAGNIVYTDKNMAIQNQTTTYVRAMYSNMLDKNTQYRVSGMVLSSGQYRLMHELKFWLD